MTSELDTVISALHSIPPDISREIWLRIGFAALAGGASVEDIVEWSRDAQNFKSERDVRSTFKKAKSDGGITVNTLYHYAYEYGWTNEEKLKNNPIKNARVNNSQMMTILKSSHNSSKKSNIRCSFSFWWWIYEQQL